MARATLSAHSRLCGKLKSMSRTSRQSQRLQTLLLRRRHRRRWLTFDVRQKMTNATLIAQRIKLIAASNEVARVSFHDGDVYDLRILSDMHVEEGGDVVAEIVCVVCAQRPGFPSVGDVLNLQLTEVADIK